MMTRTAAITIISLHILWAAISVAQTTLHQRNGAVPTQGVQALQLTEMWRVGGEADDETIFGQIIRVRSDESGRIYALDGQLQQVFVYDEQGELVQTLFGEGEGPGEVRRVRDLVFLPNGMIGAMCQFPGAMIAVDREGNPGESRRLSEPGRGYMAAAQRAGTLIVAETSHIQHENGTNTLRSTLATIDRDGAITANFITHDRLIDYQNNYTFDERQALPDFMFAFDIGPDGRLYALTDSESYVVSVFSSDGRLERTFGREFDPRQRTTNEKKRIEALVERRFRTFPFDLTTIVAETAAVSPWFLRGLQVADDGKLWIRHSRSDELGRAAGALTVFDVFDKSGRFERQVSVAVPGKPATTGIFLASNNRLVVVYGFVDAMCSVFGGGAGDMGDESDQPDPIEIVCYQITNN